MFKYDEMVNLFEKANEGFLINDIDLLYQDVSERTLCGALKESIDTVKRNENSKDYSMYRADVEYNRNGKDPKRIFQGKDEQMIICDLLLHSRGRKDPDNLIAIEMKKSTRDDVDKEKDKKRLIALTENQYNNIYRYILGVYYEIDIEKNYLLRVLSKRTSSTKKTYLLWIQSLNKEVNIISCM